MGTKMQYINKNIKKKKKTEVRIFLVRFKLNKYTHIQGLIKARVLTEYPE